MKTAPIVPAQIEFRDDGIPFSPRFGDIYHPVAGAREQAERVFLAGNGLPARWQGRERFVVLETGFGLGHNFLATLAAWRADPQRCERLWFVSVEKHPPTRDDLLRVHGDSELTAAWPPLTPNLHTLAFDDGRVTLLLALGDVAAWLPEIVAVVDAFHLDGFAPSKNPQMWDRRVFKALGRLAAPGATAATWSVAREVHGGLAEAGFVAERAPGFGGKREITVARYAPAFTPRRAPSRLARAAPRDALIVGAGLAGAATAHALARHGIACTVLDRRAAPAQETSGNPAGLFHGIVNAQDGAHARFNRAAALRATQVYAPLIASGVVPGRIDGLLRLETEWPDVQGMRRLAALGLPPGHVDVVGAAAAARQSGLALVSPAWRYAGGGWLAPAPLVSHWLDAPCIRFQGHAAVHALRRDGDRWQALDERGALIAQADVVVLANAADALRLLGVAWPLQSVRGQITRLRSPVRPAIPVAGAGYALALPDGDVLCGATSQAGDDDAQLRLADHAANAAQFARLAGVDVAELAVLDGRVGFRCTADDRLPVVGAVPARALPAGARLEQPRFVPREPGLFVCTGLGSRGITWAPLAGETLAAWIAGAPLPLEASLVDAIDAARFTSRAARRAPYSDQPPPSAR